MRVITSWTGGQADALRHALHMTNETFAAHLGVATRTVANWRRDPSIIQIPAIQETLDAALDGADERAKAHFSALIGQGNKPDHVESFELPGGSLLGASSEYGDSGYLQSIHRHIREIVALDNRFGGADLVKLSTRFFQTLHEQLGTGTYDPHLERDLQSAAAELAEVVGWLAYDSEAHDLARRMNQESLYFARMAGDKAIELLTLQNSSMHAAAQGRPREALQIARSVLEGDYRLSPRLKALFLTRKVRAQAQAGDDSALRLFPEIRSLYHEGVSAEDPSWAWWIDERELTWHEAMVQRDLGMPERAIAQFERSVIATPQTEIRSQYLHRAYLLQAQVDNATWDAVEESIRQLLPLSSEVASTRTVVLLRKVSHQLETHPRVPSALREQVTVLNAALDQAPV
jgi:tetratricopeptide (TPR) repeat protein